MIRINLLPWREERRRAQKKTFIASCIAVAVLGVVIAFAGVKYMDAQIEGQRERNELLRTEIKELDRKIREIENLEAQRAQLIERHEVIVELQRSRAQMVHLFDELVKTIPDGAYLTDIKQQGQVLTLNGRAESDARVAAYLRNLDSSPWMTSPDLQIIEATEESQALGLKDFSIKVRLDDPRSDSEEDGFALEEGA